MNTQIVKDCCSKSYLDMMRLQAEQSENWTFRFPMNKEKYIPIEEKFPKMSLIKSEVVPENAVLAGLAMGLLIQIWEKSHRAFFIPEITWCGISIKDSEFCILVHSHPKFGSLSLEIISISLFILVSTTA